LERTKKEEQEMKFALDGLRMVDFTRAQAGPVCTVLLADMGMEVIKVESAKRHDFMRVFPPYVTDDKGLNSGGMFAVYNRGKKSITLDISQPKGLELVKRLIGVSDVVVDNFSPGVMERLGLSYSAIREVKPDIVQASISGFGATGPYRHYVAFAKPIDGFSGLAELTGYIDGPPAIPGPALGDNIEGTYAAFAILAALYHRAKTGEGQFIDLSMAESVICSLPEAVMDYSMNKALRSRMGNRDDIMVPHNVYRCKGEDEWVAIAVSTDEEWDAFSKVIGKPNLSRWENEDELDGLIEEWTINHTKYEAVEILQRARVAAGPVLNSRDLLSDPHLKARDVFAVESDYPAAPGKWLAGPSWKMSDTPGGIWRRAPSEGQDNEYVYGELLGLSKEEIAYMVAEKVIY
jgi:crotonobetainyl-CoA:carnitine CoA-transferase CaiB-like acyl-CoA transferase